MHSHIICIRVDAAAEGAVYEVIAEPQGPRGKPRSRRVARDRPKAHLTLVLSSRRKASPGACPITFKFMTPTYVSNTCAVGSGIGWNPSCMILRFP